MRCALIDHPLLPPLLSPLLQVSDLTALDHVAIYVSASMFAPQTGLDHPSWVHSRPCVFRGQIFPKLSDCTKQQVLVDSVAYAAPHCLSTSGFLLCAKV